LPDEDLRNIIQVCRAAETRPGEIADSVECETEYVGAYLNSASLHRQARDKWLEFFRGISEFIAPYFDSGSLLGGHDLLLEFSQGTCRTADDARKDAELPIYQVINNPAAQWMLEHSLEALGHEPHTGWWMWRVDVAEMDAGLRALQVRAAIGLYQRRHGKLPENLDALCPEFLPSVPLDPFSGKPLRYRLAGKGWVLWSVGPDLKDDGGVDSLYAARLGSNNWFGKDGIFVSDIQSMVARIQSQTVHNLADIDAPNPDLAALAAARAAHPEIDAFGLTPLHRAANRGDLAEVRALIEKGADVNGLGLAKQIPLHVAVTRQIAELLISKGAKVQARDRWGRSRFSGPPASDAKPSSRRSWPPAPGPTPPKRLRGPWFRGSPSRRR
jgi:hypothetical protein